MSEHNTTAALLVERRHGVAVLTLNRPKVLNALNRDLLNALDGALEELRGDSSVVGVVITGAGERAFAAGADISEMANATALEARSASASGQRLFGRIEKLGKPVVAAVNGLAFGGGCELALACHIRVAAPSAKFGQPEVMLGLIPGYDGTQRLPRIVGRSMATQLILTGEQIDAEQALRLGLISEIIPGESLVARADDLIKRIGRNAPVAVRLALNVLTANAPGEASPGLDLESAMFGLCAQTEDKREGTTAFLDKRTPHFVGR